MANSFPHLNDTSFPDLQNVNTFKYQNNFNYSRWEPVNKIHLCKVLWNNDYADVVKFDSDTARDAYFDSIASADINLNTMFQVLPSVEIKIPIPYNVAATYNYVFFESKIMTSESDPINYENVNRVTRFYYFINSAQYSAPNTTLCEAQLDSWTTYINSVDIPYMVLNRGHAPMKAISVEEYLKDPIDNNELLLSPDVTFGDTSVIAKSQFVPVNNGKKYILIALNMSAAQLKSIVYPSSGNNENTAATFSDSSDRYGYQYNVNNYDWGIGGYDYSNSALGTAAYQSSDNIIPNNNCIIACSANNASTMFSNMQGQIPYLFKAIQACYMVDDTMFSVQDTFTLCGVSVNVIGKADASIIGDFTLTKDNFNFSSEYENITKLYTFPYSYIEVTDNNGNKKQIHIENISNPKIVKDVSIAFPYISIQAYIAGVNGSGTLTYKWDKLDNSEITKSIYADDFGDFLWKWDIPTYALYVNAYEAYKADNFAEQYSKRYNAIKDYQKTVRDANTEYQNAIDSAENTAAMTNNSAATELANANRGADTSYEISAASASTGKSNTYDSANAALSNANAGANTANTNANNSADLTVLNTSVSTAANATVTARNNTYKAGVTNDNNSLNKANQAWDAGLTRAVTDAENTATTVSGVMNAVNGAVNGAAGAAASLATGNALGAIGSIASGIASAADSGVSTWAAVTKNSTVAEATISNTQSKLEEINNNNSGVYELTASNNTDNTSTSNYASNTAAGNASSVMKTNASNTATTAKANASRTNSATIGNADRSYSTSISNAGELQSTSKTNAAATNSTTVANAALNKNVSEANSGYARGTSVANAQVSLEQRRIENQQDYKSKRFAAPMKIGANSGDYTLDAMERRGLQIKVRTKRKGDIAQIGDLMLRFGYALQQIWDVKNSGLNIMKNYTYWKADDIWINLGEGVAQNAQNDIKDAFMNGVTVWSDPTKVGKVSIYDN